ncbi:4-(cytidine 5'-diphospho)-2-C-methyl-D-erythritol kinase [Thalassotalea sp. G2M2-11]|uniref:4-(cytidine 5'-diphospho)-2-C-methyl-D-erythritol kinase n=1 Tax=Thalassotalea sp. G2M2-11 TaxID=2787627 RepID=UPI0019D1C42F|nr:4-(cytidine 5'-diphospho)-2-C-methyl-D-erythritol kinase [Thalassotalea sp. G2M2-11]
MAEQSYFQHFPSPAKLNLFLHIVGQRTDGYHELETVFQFLDYGDDIAIRTTAGDEIKLLTPIDGVNNEDNLIIKAAQLLQKQAKYSNGAEIKLNKVLPMGGGLGGGSSNAATVLIALNYLWQTGLSFDELATLGLSLGADVPIFIHGFSAFAQGVGEQLTPVYPKEYYYLVTKPNCSISTQAVFNAKALTRDSAKIDINAAPIDDIIHSAHNDCQSLVIKQYPEVAKLLAWLVEYAPSQMTGTGACIFSRFDTEKEARQIADLLPSSVESFVAKGVNRSILHQRMQEQLR